MVIIRHKTKRDLEEATKNSYALKAMVRHLPPSPNFKRIAPIDINVTLVVR